MAWLERSRCRLCIQDPLDVVAGQLPGLPHGVFYDRKERLMRLQGRLGALATFVVSLCSCTHSGQLALLATERPAATEENFRLKAHAWVGADADELVRTLGRPNDQYTMFGGNLVVRYQIGGGTYASTAGYAAPSGIYVGRTVTRQREVECAVEFEVDHLTNFVRDARYADDSCRSGSGEGRLQFRSEDD